MFDRKLSFQSHRLDSQGTHWNGGFSLLILASVTKPVLSYPVSTIALLLTNPAVVRALWCHHGRTVFPGVKGHGYTSARETGKPVSQVSQLHIKVPQAMSTHIHTTYTHAVLSL